MANIILGIDIQELGNMNHKRAAYFMRRFRDEEKLLGPNEQAAVDYVIALLEQSQPQQPAKIRAWSNSLEKAARHFASKGFSGESADLLEIKDAIQYLMPAQAQQPKDNLSLGEPIIKMHEDEPDIIFGSDIQKLGAKLADLLDEDQFADCEQLLLSIASAQSKQDSKIQSIGVVQHYAAPSGAAPYVTVRWEKQTPNHGAKVYASLPTKEAECAHMRKIIFQVFNDDAFLSLAAGVRENVSIVVNNLPLAPKEGT